MEEKKNLNYCIHHSHNTPPPPPPSLTTTKITFSPHIIPSMGEQTQTKPHYTPTPPQPSTLPSQSSKSPHQLRPWKIRLKFPTNPYYHHHYRKPNPKTKIHQIKNHLAPHNPIHTFNPNNVCFL